MKRRYITPFFYTYHINNELSIICSSSSKASRNPFTNNSTNIVIVGPKGSGKSTIWRGLGFKNVSETSGNEKVGDKRIRYNLKWININETKDYGGDSKYVEYYDDIINDHNTTIYFVIALLMKYEDGTIIHALEKEKEEIRVRIRKIETIAKTKKLENCKITFVATWFDLFSERRGQNKKDAELYVTNTLDIKSLNCKSINIDNRILVVDARNSSDISLIKEDIFN